ncbi:IpaD/SipD/SspD family type III secretion system needle tip protein [Erwinia tasmaniensis]|uniref:Invasin-like protein (36 kDa membrane antigen) n=1 Tax=Erwinia tasmaniensis (strain DSM 17950 / CFBP 7177 / CIP 109463 / NCPPB 4357 / Et1/99) TaxID=465817 RepID=B2VG37_ERWT9|nr:IpaD/SipD/SspD family type III secretion system needle tip protein [Erwinia tasmaniensis]CAO97726.1 Putative invasin-like protein (36 kDa membrane antigen) [Erwinia tasmaniensis Et1/99]
MSCITQVQPQNPATYLPLEQSDQKKDILTQARANIKTSNNMASGEIALMASSEEVKPTKSFISALFYLLLSPGYNKLENITKLFADNQLDSRGYTYAPFVLEVSLQSLKSSYEENETIFGETASQSIAKQKLLVEKGGDAIGNIHWEVSKNILNTKSAHGSLAVKLTRQEKDSDNNTREEITTGTSYAELWARISIMIGNIKSDYVDFYAELMKKYTDMYEAFNSTVQKASSDAVTSGEDGNSVTFDRPTMKKGYKEFSAEIEKIDLGTVKNWDKMSQEEKNSLVMTLEPAFKVNTKGKIEFNLEPYMSSVNNTYPGTSSGNISTASYQAWLATFNSAGSSLQSNMQAFSQRYTQANSTFDQLNKMLSGVINSLGDSAKDVLKSLS